MFPLLIALSFVGCDYRVATYARTYAQQAPVYDVNAQLQAAQLAAYLQQAAAEQQANARLDRIEAALRALTVQPTPQPQPQPQVSVEYAPQPAYATPQYQPPAPAKSYPTPQAPPKAPPIPQSQYPAPVGDAPEPPPSLAPGPTSGVLGHPNVVAMATVLRNRCAGCHAGDASRGGGIQLLDTDGQVADVAARLPEIMRDLSTNRMPKGGPPLSDAEKMRIFTGMGILSSATSTASR